MVCVCKSGKEDVYVEREVKEPERQRGEQRGKAKDGKQKRKTQGSRRSSEQFLRGQENRERQT